jgi:dolichol-phosphate mannosyltransferase
LIAVVLPAYNEEPEIPRLLERFDRFSSEMDEPVRVLVVDDGSRDQTAAVARNAGVRIPVEVIVHESNKGLGGALRTGLTHAAKGLAPDDAVVTLDADNTHDPRYVRDLRERMLADNLDVVVCSRYASGGQEVGVTAGRRLLSRGASFLYGHLLHVRGLSDYTCGYRIFRASVLQAAVRHLGDQFIEETSFAATGEIILKLRRFTDRFGEVPFVLRYDMKEAPSKMNKIKTVLRTLKVLRKYRHVPKPPGATESPVSREPGPDLSGNRPNPDESRGP